MTTPLIRSQLATACQRASGANAVVLVFLEEGHRITATAAISDIDGRIEPSELPTLLIEAALKFDAEMSEVGRSA